MKTIHVCTACGSPRVLLDACVGLNDPDDVRTYDRIFCDNIFCEDCGGECSTKLVEVKDDFDIEEDTYFELEMS